MIIMPPDAEGAGLSIAQQGIAGTKQIVVADLHHHGDVVTFKGVEDTQRHVVIDIEYIGDIRPRKRFQQPAQFDSGFNRVDASIQKAQNIDRGKPDVCPKRLLRVPGGRHKIVLIRRRPCPGVTDAERNGRMPSG